MAEGMNKVLLIGNLGAEPDLRYTQSGKAVLNIRLATNERYQDKTSGEWQDKTEWHTVIVWGPRAEGLKKVLDKGSQIAVEGKIQTRQWEDRDGGKRYTTEILGMKTILLSSPKRQERQPGDEPYGQPPPPQDFSDDDIPF